MNKFNKTFNTIMESLSEFTDSEMVKLPDGGNDRRCNIYSELYSFNRFYYRNVFADSACSGAMWSVVENLLDFDFIGNPAKFNGKPDRAENSGQRT